MSSTFPSGVQSSATFFSSRNYVMKKRRKSISYQRSNPQSYNETQGPKRTFKASTYSSQLLTCILANLFPRSNFSCISLVDPLTLILKKLAANPLPYEYIAILFPAKTSLSVESSKDANEPKRDAVYMLPSFFEVKVQGNVLALKRADEATMKAFSTSLLRRVVERSRVRRAGGIDAKRGSVGLER